jgi:hypothetical protein
LRIKEQETRLTLQEHDDDDDDDDDDIFYTFPSSFPSCPVPVACKIASLFGNAWKKKTGSRPAKRILMKSGTGKF